ncbi:tyrosine-type recombinase/integrase [Vagococcus penaei]|uniref:Tyr recombinase domain-containing protein n=1 Tax=Vagococcus penaei TaxID=633807 RepID=A0A1Q2D3D3_9ENTE|nr:tyrosine-type recombinase/integrase [Vagococcus penaei]AQP52880.1 hypothetical protein BW732_00675 [Vagococcus penaei]
MKMTEEKFLRMKLDERLLNFTPTMRLFIEDVLQHRSTATAYEYTKDLSLLLEFTKMTDKTTVVSDDRMCHLSFVHYTDFFQYIKSYRLSFVSPTGNQLNQTFTNSTTGVNRKIATMLRWTKFIEENNYSSFVVYPDLALYDDTRPAKTYLMPETIQTLLQGVSQARAVTNWQAQQYAEKTKQRDLALIVLMLYSGLKVEECLNLTLEDIDLTRHQVFVERNPTREQQIILPLESQEYLRDYLKLRTHIELGDSNLLFESLHQGKMHQKTVRLMLKKYSERFNLTTIITPQLLRNTCEHQLYLLFDKSNNKVNWAVGRRYNEFKNQMELQNRWLNLTYTTD